MLYYSQKNENVLVILKQNCKSFNDLQRICYVKKKMKNTSWLILVFLLLCFKE